MAQKTMIQAITEAMDQALEKDENILIFGEDVGKNGGVSVQQLVFKPSTAKIVCLTHRWLNPVSVV